VWPVQVSDNLVSPNFSFKTLDSHPRTPVSVSLGMVVVLTEETHTHTLTHREASRKKGGKASVDGLPAVRHVFSFPLFPPYPNYCYFGQLGPPDID